MSDVIYKNSLSPKFIAPSLISEGLLDQYLADIGDYKGPFKKSIFVTHGRIIKEFKKRGVSLYKNKRDNRYYIEALQSSKPILFNPDLLDIEEEK